MVLKWSDVYIENIRMVSLIAGFKMEGLVEWRGLKLQGPLYYHFGTELLTFETVYIIIWDGLLFKLISSPA